MKVPHLKTWLQHPSVVPGVPESLLEVLVGLKGSLRFKTFDFLEELEGVKGLLGRFSRSLLS